MNRTLASVIAPLLAAAFARAAIAQGGSICATVRLQLDQEVTISRTAFRAQLDVNNGTDFTLENFFAQLEIKNEMGEVSTHLWGIPEPELTGITSIAGDGLIPPHSSGMAIWTLIPSRDAAPVRETRYTVGGMFSYIQDGEPITVPLFPVTITVLPDASLAVKYYWQRDVYSDNPFTPEIEPAEPFVLGLTMTNEGAGAARNVRLTTSQPRIIENERGLLISFALIATQVGAQPISPSMTINFGNIDPGATGNAYFFMTSTLEGQFTEYQASFQHINGLGNPRLSLIDRVEIYELIHLVRSDGPDAPDDGLPDFMTNDIPDDDGSDLPDTLHLSTGGVQAVTVVPDPAVSFGRGAADGTVEATITVSMPVSWGYFSIPDPTNGLLPLTRVTRQDGKELFLGTNAWITDRTFLIPGEKPERQHKLHIFDQSAPGAPTVYTALFTADTDAPGVASWHAAAEHGVLGDVRLAIPPGGGFSESRSASGLRRVAVTFDEPIRPSSVTSGSIGLSGRRGPDGAVLDLSGTVFTANFFEANRVMILSFNPPLPDFARYRLRLTGLKDFAGNPLPAGTEIGFVALAGDVTGDQRVNNTDVGAVRSLRGTDPILLSDLYHIRSDLDLDGRITVMDEEIALAARGRDARFIPAPPEPTLIRSRDSLIEIPSDDPGPAGTEPMIAGAPASGDPARAPGASDAPAAAKSVAAEPAGPPFGDRDASHVLAEGDAAAFAYRFFEHERPLTPDLSRLHVEPKPGAEGAPYEHEVPMSERSLAGLRHLAARLAFTGPVQFVSPVFLDAQGEAFRPASPLSLGLRPGADPAATLDALRALAGLPVEIRPDPRFAGAYLMDARTLNGAYLIDLAAKLAAADGVWFAEPAWIPLTAAAVPPTSALDAVRHGPEVPGDANRDGVTDAEDVRWLLAQFGGAFFDPRADVNRDDALDAADLAVVVRAMRGEPASTHGMSSISP